VDFLAVGVLPGTRGLKLSCTACVQVYYVFMYQMFNLREVFVGCSKQLFVI
jgi:hypothetical protein